MLLFSRLALILAAVVAPSDDLPAQGEVAVDVLNVYDSPLPTAFCAGRLLRGAAVTIRHGGAPGWLAIDPPSNSYDWIDQDAIEIEAGSVDALVVSARAPVRSAPAGARLPGPPVSERAKGDRVHLVDADSLAVTITGSRHTLRAIVPAAGEVRYVRADSIKQRTTPASPTDPVPDTSLARVAGTDLSAELAQTEAMHRAIVRGPVEGWQLEPVNARYKALLEHAGDSATSTRIRDRLSVVARQEEMAQDARTFESVLQRSRLRDRGLAAIRQRLASVKVEKRTSFDAEGMIQPSAKKVEGEKVLALIGADGFAVAYLRVPPGLDTRPLLTHRVGVRGAVHYDEHLRARVIAVRDMEAIEPSRSALRVGDPFR